MWRGVVHSAFIAGAALMLSACSFADSHAYLPGFMRIKAADPPPPEAAPDVKQMVSANLNSVFVATSYPHAVRVSPPLHDPRGPGWNACVRAELTNAVGKPLGTETYRITIDGGEIVDRRRVEPDDNCASESYEPIETMIRKNG
jgi:hypothetical protein